MTVLLSQTKTCANVWKTAELSSSKSPNVNTALSYS